MADDEKPAGSPAGDLLFILSIIGVLTILWFAMGARKAADVRGIFIHPPAPVGQGGSYGPVLDTSTAKLQPAGTYPQ